MIGASRPMNAWRPPAFSTRSAPGCSMRWYVLLNMSCTFAACSSWCGTDFIAPMVPTATYPGVSMTPCGV
eukprot:30118-Pelagococcus_subviridis.AAC.6